MIGISEYGNSRLIFTSGLELLFSLKCKISNRDLTACHATLLLLYLVIESVWEGGRGRSRDSWVASNYFCSTLLCDKKKKSLKY